MVESGKTRYNSALPYALIVFCSSRRLGGIFLGALPATRRLLQLRTSHALLVFVGVHGFATASRCIPHSYPRIHPVLCP